MSNIKSIFLKRTIYALIIVAIIIPIFILTFYAQIPGRIIGMIFYILLAALGVYEVCTFMTKRRIMIVIFALVLMIGTFLLPYNIFLTTILNDNAQTSVSLKEIIYLHFSWETFIFPIFVVVLLILIDKNLHHDFKSCLKNFGIIFITSFLAAFLAKGIWIINIFDWTKLIFVLSIGIVSDTFAYIGGFLFGKKWFHGAKLAPSISPSKTWAGAIIAFIVTFVFTSLISYYIGFWDGIKNGVDGEINMVLILTILGSLLLAIMAQLGDLLFSWFKRILDIKDFSSLIPIHGGIFDRIDGISLVVFFTIILFIVA